MCRESVANQAGRKPGEGGVGGTREEAVVRRELPNLCNAATSSSLKNENMETSMGLCNRAEQI